MPIASGTQLGSHEIIALLGKGGMGEVYRARDIKLKREVAIKILPDEFSRDPERVSRFQREAEVLASLNHPNIAGIYDLQETTGIRFLVLELVEGETLAERIQRGPVPVAEAVEIAKHLCEALEAAHEKGIVHRDLKPANVKIAPDGLVKVLDFGLAKAVESGPATGALSNSPTLLTMGATQAGVVLGTAGYMSPEQASGKLTDYRSDIWSFGVVFYEMLTGTSAFPGESISDTLASVLKLDPDWRALPAATPASIRNLIQRCLTKNRKQRLQAIGEARIALQNPIDDAPAPVRAPSRSWTGAAGWVAAAALAAGLAVTLWMSRRPAPPPQVFEFDVTLPPGVRLAPNLDFQFSLSPDGTKLVFHGIDRDGTRRLWLRPLGTNTSTPLSGSEGAVAPFWSPDSRFLAFFAGGRLVKSNLSGQPQAIAGSVSGLNAGAWSEDDVILFSEQGKPVQRVPASGGTPTAVVPLDTAQEEILQAAPSFLPGGQRFLYASFSKNRGIMLGSLDGTTRRLLTTPESPAFYTPNPDGGGWLLYVAGGQLFARPFNAAKAEFTGEAALVADSIPTGIRWSASANGVLALRHTRIPETQLTWVNRSGTPMGVVGDPGAYNHPRISPDGKTIAYTKSAGEDRGIWLLDVARNVATRLVQAPARTFDPVWSPNGASMLYSHDTPQETSAAERGFNGSDGERILIQKPRDSAVLFVPTGVSADGRWIVVTERGQAQVNNRILLVSRRGSEMPIELLNGRNVTSQSLSPDGKWLVYSQGVGSQLFVRPMPKEAGGPVNTSAPVQISVGSTSGGSRWRSDGREILYIAADGNMMSVPVDYADGFFRPGTPQVLFASNVNPLPFGFTHDWDVTPDGQRFLINQPVAQNETAPITVIVNWPQLLKK